jgi:hypothetical protein
MSKSVSYVGLDVHKDTIVIAMAMGKQRAVVVSKIANDWAKLLRTCFENQSAFRARRLDIRAIMAM